MTDIQRYIAEDYYLHYNNGPVHEDDLVLYSAHVEALRQAEQRVEARWVEIARIDRENARADESKIMTRMALEAIDDAHERGIKRGQQDERKRSFLLIADAYKQGREQGQRDALAAAVQRVEAIVVQSRWGTTSHGLIGKGEALAAIKGEQA